MPNSIDQSDEQVSVSSPIDTAIRIGLISLMVFWCLYIALPFATPVIWGIIIAIGSYPAYRWLQKKLGTGDGLTATIFTLVMLAIIITPSLILSAALVEEAKSVSENFQQDTLKIPLPPEGIARLPIVGKEISEVWTGISQNPKESLGEFENQVKQIGKWLLKAVAGVGLSMLMFTFSIIIAGVFLATASGGKQAANRVFIRLAGDKGAEMTVIAGSTIKSVVNGILGIALLQTLLAGIGFVVMDIPAAGALALVCLVLAVVQIDILLILIPLSIYVFSTASTGPAIAFLIWNVGVGLLNNVLKPILLGRGVDAPMMVIFIGAIGGMIAHGIIGLFVGAVVVTLGYTLFMAWLEGTAETSLQSPSASSKE